MSPRRLHFFLSLRIVVSCTTETGPVNNSASIGQLRTVKIDLTDVRVEASSEKAMQSYQKFLEQTPDAAMTPEALRRLADLKIQQEYGTLEGVKRNERRAAQLESRRSEAEVAANLDKPAELPKPVAAPPASKGGAAKKPELQAKGGKQQKASGKNAAQPVKESNQAFEARASKIAPPKSAPPVQALATPDGNAIELQGGAGEAIQLYKKLLARYPNFARKDQVLYQLARAYEELGMVDEAMKVMVQIAKEYSKSRYVDEVQFRIGEYHFTRKKYLDAEDAFKSIIEMGPGTPYYELALYKLGWTFYKQDLYEDSLHRFIALLDHKIKTGYDFENPKDSLEHKRIEDTYQVISLGFSNLGGPPAVIAYFEKFGRRAYEVDIYGNLGEYYLEKRRYNDAAVSYKAFVKQNPFHKVAPHYDTRVIDIYKRGGFPKLVIEANKEFVVNYGLKSAYWNNFDVKAFPAVVGYVKASLIELAGHYHALYQEKRFEKNKPENFQEALRWYREFMTSFAKETESPAINHQMAELLLENKTYDLAAVEFERTAYDYPSHGKAAEAGYAAVYAHRHHLAAASVPNKEKIKSEVIRSSLKFAETFFNHEKAALVMSAAIDDIFALKNYAHAVTASRKFNALFPQADLPIRRSTWLILAHSSFELGDFKDAEEGYLQVLPLILPADRTRADLIENLAASIYKQGEQASKASDHKAAAEHFLRVAKAAPTSTIRQTADYDGAAALIQLKDWDRAAAVLSSFRASYPGHTLQPEVTKKMAHVYRESGKQTLAASEYERIETETKDVEVRSAALQLAGDLYLEAKETDQAVKVYRRYLGYFPKPLDLALENRLKIATILKSLNDTEGYFAELRLIVSADASGGNERTNRTRYLGASSLLALSEQMFERFAQIKLVKPFDQNLSRKKAGLKQVKDAFESILRYEIGETTAAATYYLAEMYYNFNRSLVESERPTDLTRDEKEQYELALEEQAFPFEEKAIEVHQKTTELIKLGVFNAWVEKSFAKLALLVPARYAKFEQSSGYVQTMDRGLAYSALTEPKPRIVKAPIAAEPAMAAEAEEGESQKAAAPVLEDMPAEPVPAADVTPELRKQGGIPSNGEVRSPGNEPKKLPPGRN